MPEMNPNKRDARLPEYRYDEIGVPPINEVERATLRARHHSLDIDIDVAVKYAALMMTTEGRDFRHMVNVLLRQRRWERLLPGMSTRLRRRDN